MFKKGDRVQCLIDCPDDNQNIHAGDFGTVCYTPIDRNYVRVRWDNYVNGHDCMGYCEYGYGWTVRKKDIQLYEEEAEEEIDAGEFLELLTIR